MIIVSLLNLIKVFHNFKILLKKKYCTALYCRSMEYSSIGRHEISRNKNDAHLSYAPSAIKTTKQQNNPPKKTDRHQKTTQKDRQKKTKKNSLFVFATVQYVVVVLVQ